MQKYCSSCEGAFKDMEQVIVVAPSTFKYIPSRVHFSLAVPGEVMELYHPECYAEVSGNA